ncbi:MAG: helix-turn-helix domain-containing protein [Bacillota bacterium]
MTQVSSSERLAYTAGELAARLGITRKALYGQLAAGRIPHVRVGRRVYFPVRAIEDWLAARLTPAREG